MTPRADTEPPAGGSVLPSPPAPNDPPRAGFARRALRAATAPVRFAARRPLRFTLYLALALLLATGLAATGAWVWFDHHLSAARSEVARGHNAAALRHLDQCRRLRPDHPTVLVLCARVARRAGSWDETEILLDRYVEVHGHADEAVLERLLLRATRGELEEAAALQARVRDGGPDADLAREALIAGLTYRFEWAAAFRRIEEWLAADPDSTHALLLRGKLDEQRFALAPALETYKHIVELDPDHDEARLRVATLLVANRFGEEAAGHLAVLRRRLPGHPEVAVLWARALALQGKSAESRAALDECLRGHPDYAPALAEAGGQALNDGDETRAEQLLARAVALDPGDVNIRGRYAFALARAGKKDESAREEARVAALKADLERITALLSGPLHQRPNDPQVPHEIGAIALRSGQVREAIRWFNVALRIDPGHVPTHNALGALYHNLDNPVLAAKHRALARGRGPGSAGP